MEIIEVDKKCYRLSFVNNFLGCEFSFPCDEAGNIQWEKAIDLAKAQDDLAFCRACPERWTNGKIVWYIRHECYGICPHCGRKIFLDGYDGPESE